MYSNFQSFVFIELIEKTRVRGALFVCGQKHSWPKKAAVLAALTKPRAAGRMKRPRNLALVPEWRNWQTR